MKFKIVRIELKGEKVLIFMKSIEKEPDFFSNPEIRSPAQLLEFGLQMSEAVAKRIEESLGFDAFVTLKYDDYAARELKVGDVVEIELKEVE